MCRGGIVTIEETCSQVNEDIKQAKELNNMLVICSIIHVTLCTYTCTCIIIIIHVHVQVHAKDTSLIGTLQPVLMKRSSVLLMSFVSCIHV